MVIHSCTKWYKVVQSCTEWYRVVQSCTELYSVVNKYGIVHCSTKLYGVEKSCTSSLAWPDRFFSFDVWAEKKKGLACYRCMFCAQNRQILAIVDWPLIGVDSLQRRSNDAY